MEFGGKTTSQVAMEMAHFLILNVDGKEIKQIKRDDYLATIAQCVDALGGSARK
jgi:hypothetical protein